MDDAQQKRSSPAKRRLVTEIDVQQTTLLQPLAGRSFNLELWLLLENKSFISLSMLDLGWATVKSLTSHRQLTTAQCLLCMFWEFYELDLVNFKLCSV